LLHKSLQTPLEHEEDDADEGAQGGDYPEAHGDFRFRPAQRFKVMMDGR